MEELFNYLKPLLGSKYNVTLQTMHEDRGNQLGVFFYQGIEDNEDLTGQQVYECYNLHFQLNCEKSEAAVFEGEKDLRALVDYLETRAFGNDEVEIFSITRKGAKVAPIGSNEFGYPVLVSNLQVLYLLTDSTDEDEENTPSESESEESQTD